MSTIRVTVDIPHAAWMQADRARALLTEELNRGMFTLVNQGADTAKLLAPVNLGILRSSMTAEVLAPGPGALATGVLYTGPQSSTYAAPVEYGAAPHWAPIAPLKQWAKRVLGAEELGYAIQRAIARRGTRAQPYFTPAAEEMQRDAPGVMREALTLAVQRLGGV